MSNQFLEIHDKLPGGRVDIWSVCKHGFERFCYPLGLQGIRDRQGYVNIIHFLVTSPCGISKSKIRKSKSLISSLPLKQLQHKILALLLSTNKSYEMKI